MPTEHRAAKGLGESDGRTGCGEGVEREQIGPGRGKESLNLPALYPNHSARPTRDRSDCMGFHQLHSG